MERKLIFFRKILSNWSLNKNSDKAAAIAFYALFSLPPLFFLSFNLAALIFKRQNVENAMLEWLEHFASPEVIIAVKDIFNSSANLHLTSSIISFLILFYFSAKIFTKLRESLNDIYRTGTPKAKGIVRNFLYKNFASFILVSLTCLLISITLLVNFMLNKLSMGFHDRLSNFTSSDFINNLRSLHLLNNFSSIVILGGIFFAIYKFLPMRKIKRNSALVGTLVGIILFEIGKYLFALYLSISFIVSFYGPMGSLVIIMFWVYYTVQIVLLGAEFAIGVETSENYIYRKKTA